MVFSAASNRKFDSALCALWKPWQCHILSQKHAITLLLSQQERAVTQWRGVAHFLRMMYGYPDLVPAVGQFDESKVLGPAPFEESAGAMRYRYGKDFMEWLTDPLPRKVTVSTVKRTLRELRQLQGICNHVYHLNLPIHNSQRCHARSVGNMLSGIPFLLLTVEACYE